MVVQRSSIVQVLDYTPDERQSGMRGFKGVLTGAVDQGGRPGDILGTSSILYLVSGRVLTVFEENNFEKYEAFPALIRGGRELPDYYAVAFLGRGGPILPEESGVEWSYRPDGTRIMMRVRSGIHFDESQWDGSDLFYLEEWPGAHLVTDRVVTALKRAKITNFEARPLSTIRW